MGVPWRRGGPGGLRGGIDERTYAPTYHVVFGNTSFILEQCGSARSCALERTAISPLNFLTLARSWSLWA
jgi:hypothetical protein